MISRTAPTRRFTTATPAPRHTVIPAVLCISVTRCAVVRSLVGTRSPVRARATVVRRHSRSSMRCSLKHSASKCRSLKRCASKRCASKRHTSITRKRRSQAPLITDAAQRAAMCALAEAVRELETVLKTKHLACKLCVLQRRVACVDSTAQTCNGVQGDSRHRARGTMLLAVDTSFMYSEN